MTMTNLVSFARRHNRDASVDSICTRCYQTIASADNVSELASPEQSHVCNLNGEFNRQPVDFQLESVL